MKMPAVLLLTFFFGLSFAHANEEIVNLPEGQVELTDLLGPQEIYQDMLTKGVGEELDLEDLDATATDASQTKIYIYVSKAKQHLWVYMDGQLMSGWDWPVSTGTEQLRCPPAPAKCRIAHTPTGARQCHSDDGEHRTTDEAVNLPHDRRPNLSAS